MRKGERREYKTKERGRKTPEHSWSVHRTYSSYLEIVCIANSDCFIPGTGCY